MVYGVPSVSTPTLQIAEKPTALNELPQCTVTNSEVDVNRVDRLALQDQPGVSGATVGEVGDRTSVQKEWSEYEKASLQQENGNEGTVVESTATSAKEVRTRV